MSQNCRKIDVARRLGAIAVVCLFSGCAMVGPDYVRPEIPLPDAWNEAVQEEFSSGAPALQTWWSSFGDPVLDDLIAKSDEGNLDLKVAVARLDEARARYAIARGERLPDIDGSGAAGWTRSSEDTVPSIQPGLDREGELFSLGAGISWELDLWGRVRRSIESADAAFQSSLEDYRDVMVLLYADVASAYVDVRSLQARLEYAVNNATAQRDTLQLTKDRYKAGLVPELDVRQAELNLATTSATIPQLRTLLAQAVNRLAVLTGQHPGSLKELLASTAAIPAPPAEVMVSLPADLLRQRPDVRRAERVLASQNARIGVATGDLYPIFSLTGTFALEALDADGVFDGGSLAYGFGPAFRWNLFDGGRVRNAVKVEEARTRQALHRYENTVLLALEDVENAMVGLAEERKRNVHLQTAVSAAQDSAGLVKELYRIGLTDFQNVLDMERALTAQQDQFATSSGSLSINCIRLYRSLGGGWDASAVQP